MPSSRQSIISEALAFTTNQLLEFSYSVLSAMILPIIQMCECKEVSMSVLAESPAMNEAEVHEAIVRRARALWEQRGRMDGHATEDWAQAEAEIREQLAASRDASRHFCLFNPRHSFIRVDTTGIAPLTGREISHLVIQFVSA
jgi:hypothetical protein